MHLFGRFSAHYYNRRSTGPGISFLGRAKQSWTQPRLSFFLNITYIFEADGESREEKTRLNAGRHIALPACVFAYLNGPYAGLLIFGNQSTSAGRIAKICGQAKKRLTAEVYRLRDAP
jgi:hypothetical protein